MEAGGANGLAGDAGGGEAEEKAAAASQQSHRSDKPPNRRVTLPVGESSGLSVARLSCKSGCRILDRQNQPIGDEKTLDVSSDFLE